MTRTIAIYTAVPKQKEPNGSFLVLSDEWMQLSFSETYPISSIVPNDTNGPVPLVNPIHPGTSSSITCDESGLSISAIPRLGASYTRGSVPIHVARSLYTWLGPYTRGSYAW